MISENKKGRRAIISLFKYLIFPILLIEFVSWKIAIALILIFLIRDIIKIRKRKYLIKDKSGKKVKTKEFFKRWKEGIEGITPLQQSKTNLMGNWIVLTGILAGVIVNALVRMKDQWWWIEVILLGSLVLVVLQMVSGFQRYWRIKEVDRVQKELEEEMNEKVSKINKKEFKVKEIKMVKVK